jgi:DNA-binding NtrC family response regulator
LPDRIIKHNASLPAPQPAEVQSIADLEKKAIVEALKMHGTTNRAKESIARYLGMSRSTLYRKIKELDIHLDD